MTLAEQVLSVLEAAHDEGIVHRDVKPSNIMIALVPSEQMWGTAQDKANASSSDDSDRDFCCVAYVADGSRLDKSVLASDY